MKGARVNRCAAVAIAIAISGTTWGCVVLRGKSSPPAADDAVAAAVARLVRQAAAEEDHDAAIDALTAFGPAAVPYLSKALTDPDESVRLAAVETLGKTRGDDVVDALLTASKDTSWSVRLNAVQALGALGDRRAVQPLLDQSSGDDSPQVRYECLTSLGLIGDPVAVGVLVKDISDADPYMRMWAIDALCQMRDGHAPELAVALLRDPNAYVRQHVVEACGDAFDSADGRRALIEVALDAQDFPSTVWARRHLTSSIEHHPDGGNLAAQVRARALEALNGKHAARAALLLGDLGDPAATDQLIEALHDPDFLVRHHAALLLARVADRRAVPPLISLLDDPVELVAASAFNSLQWFADDGDQRARGAVRGYKGKRFTERLPR